MTILTLSIISIILAITIILCIAFWDDSSLVFCLTIISIFGLIIIGIAGFGVHCGDGTEHIKIEKTNKFFVVKSKISTYVEFDTTTIKFTSKKDYDLINDSTFFYKITYFNYYNNINKISYTYDTIYKNKPKNTLIDY